ncbi:MAG: AzlD domain-containing protein [Betaproteobacteria bacterium]|jgi:branched-subunit amino acid transport protein|nr:AzlD domain-containing protein [Candidatus Fonsibacter lacus]
MTEFNQTDGWTLVATLGMTVVVLMCRGSFILPGKSWRLPAWLQRGLTYAPIAALAAVIAPEILLRDGVPLTDWKDARLVALVAGLLWFFLRGKGVLGTMLLGMAVYLPLHLGLGW